MVIYNVTTPTERFECAKVDWYFRRKIAAMGAMIADHNPPGGRLLDASVSVSGL